MSEADLPTPESFDQPAEAPLSESAPSSEASLSPAVTPDEEWETVNFPNAIPLEELLSNFITELEQSPVTEEHQETVVPEMMVIAGSEETEMATASLMSAEAEAPENPVRVVQILHQCNQDLIHRVAELEAELDENRQNRQDKDTELLQRTQELSATQEQVKRLFKKLEIANQVIRQQQVLLETLTQQWEVCQTRLARMERDCALTQQRYNEQFHELVQAQNSNRELRSRLHRQQRQTLQFKVALERCLENQIQFETSKQSLETLPTIKKESPVFYSSGLLTHKAPPVQPWSVATTVKNQPMNPIQDEGDLDDQTSSEFEMGLPLVETLSAGLESATSKNSEATDHELFKPPVELTSSHEVPVSEWPKPQFIEGELERIRLEYTSFISEDADLFLLQTSSENTTIQQPSTQSIQGQSFNLEVTKSQSVSAVAVRDVEEKDNQDSNWPAPLIYPQRRKKLESLASIHLPSFPK